MNTFYAEHTWFKEHLSNKALIAKLKKIKLVITDVDGTLTNGNILIPRAHEEKELKGISMQDDFMIGKALEANIQFAIITGRKNYTFKQYVHKLGIPSSLYFEGVDKDKFKVVPTILKKLKLSRNEALNFGDEYLDYEIKPYVSLYCIPANAPCYFYPYADIVTWRPGGQGALRMLLDLMLYVQKKHFAQDCIDRMVNN